MGWATAGAPWSTSLDDLDPAVRARVDRVIARLRAEGYDPRPSCTWRSDAVQGLLVQAPTATQAGAGQSCHNGTRGDAPAARAVDLWDGGLGPGLVVGLDASLAAQVPFLRALGAAAKAEGLRWGGDWHGHPSAWDAYGLGWDPAHVELPPCGG